MQQAAKPMSANVIVEAPAAARTMGTLSQRMSGKSSLVDEAVAQPQMRTIVPIYKPVPRYEPVVPAPIPIQEATPVIAPQEEVFMDAFSQSGMKPETEMLRSSHVAEKLH